ncbi:uncharacterized protein LOC133328620 [Musca vetustissima]|uniref:uncharacterized protein LOC133328620 n=1 Tax=Musca vetustissima TaxID=27455 RepID=UPI002AB681E9|nr:uncharacterized protein LOC133328620 [Musca vetustissima]
MAQQNANIPSSCVLCSNPDDEHMVTCSRCKINYHLICCNIDDDRGVINWMCQKCQEQQQNMHHNLNVEATANGTSTEHIDETSYFQQPSASGSHQTMLTTTLPTGFTIKTQLQLRQLEEEMALREEFLRRKYELLQNNGVQQTNIMGNISREPDERSADNNIHTQESEQPQVFQCQQNASISTQHNYSRGNVMSTQARLSGVNRDQNHNNDISTLNQPLYHSTHRNILPLYSNESDVHRHQVGDGLNIPHASTLNNNSYLTDPNVNNNTSDINISATQFFARQSFSKDLPHFNGDPREWPIFISAFEQSTNAAGYSNEENLIRLQKCLHGKARDAVRNCLMLPDMVPDIIRTLKMYFGRPECVLKSLIDDIRKMILPKGKLEALIEFAFAIKNMCATIRASKLDDYIMNPTLLQELVEKLSPDMMIQWALHSKDKQRPTLIDFSDWLYIIAEATCRVTVPNFEFTNDKKTSRKENRLNTHFEHEDKRRLPVCFLCEDAHKLSKCSKFNEMTTTERWDLVKSKNLCCICLGRHRRKCWFQRECGVNGCIVRHSPLLHSDDYPGVSTLSTINNHKASGTQDSFFRIVPVTLYNNSKSVTIFALMDDGSSLTLLEEGVADKLGVTGITDPLCMRWTGDVVRFEDASRRFDLKISAKNSSIIYPLQNVHTVESLNLSPETLLLKDIRQKYPYLVDVPLEEYEDAVPSMIIGVNNPNLISSIKTREGKWHQPVASKTRLGWTLFGGNSMVATLNVHSCVCTKDAQLHKVVKQFFSGESDCTDLSTYLAVPQEDERALRIMRETCTFKDGRYEVGLLWKEDNTVLPNSLPTAMKRLNCIKKKARRDTKIAEVLQQQIEGLVEKGYAEKLPSYVLEQEIGKVWYLPTFIVKNPHKPNKVRLVWDAAAKTGNVSLNDFLLKGPDLLRPLMHVIFKFRIGAVAVCGDIAEMFHRIRVRKADASAQRFLWWDSQNPVLIYQLNVLTFGASCSPFISHYVRNKNAEAFGHEDSKVIEAITKQHYVDDFIDSTDTVAEAIELSQKVKEVHACGGFVMRNWLSNSDEVLQALGEVQTVMNKNFECNENINQYEKVLGLYWDSKSDTFKINLKFVRIKRPIFVEDIIPTKREVLQVLMSVFDPLGFVACFMSYLKTILQHIWRSGIEWDEALNNDLYTERLLGRGL